MSSQSVNRPSSKLASCWRGVCYGLGFATGAVFLIVMIWILWCYLGFMSLPTIAPQRRALVDYGTTDLKPVEGIQSIPPSLFQQDNSTSSSHSSPVGGNSRGEAQLGLDKRRDYATARTEDGLAKGDFNARDKFSTNSSNTQSRGAADVRDTEIKSTSIINNTHQSSRDFLDNDRPPLIKDDAESVIRRIILPSITDNKSPIDVRGSREEKLIENGRKIDSIDINNDNDRATRPLGRDERRPSRDDGRYYDEERPLVRNYSAEDRSDKRPNEGSSRRQLDDSTLDREYSKDRRPYDQGRDDYPHRRYDHDRRDYGGEEDDRRILDRDIYGTSREKARDSSTRDIDDRYKDDRYREDRYRDDRYKDDRYRDDRYKDDRYRDDRYSDDRYRRRSSDEQHRDSEDKYQSRYGIEDRHVLRKGDDGSDDGYKSSDENRRDDRSRSSDANRKDDRYKSTDESRKDDRYKSTDESRKDDRYRYSDDNRKDDGYRTSDENRRDDRYRSSDENRKDDRYRSSDENRRDDRYRDRTRDYTYRDDSSRRDYDEYKDRMPEDDEYRRRDDRYKSRINDEDSASSRDVRPPRKESRYSDDVNDRKDITPYRDDIPPEAATRSKDYIDYHPRDRVRNQEDDYRGREKILPSRRDDESRTGIGYDTRYHDSDRRRTQIKDERYDDDRYERDPLPRRYDDRVDYKESRSIISKGDIPIRDRSIYLVEDRTLSKSLGGRSYDVALDRRRDLTSDDDHRSTRRRVDNIESGYRDDRYDERRRYRSDYESDFRDRLKGEYDRDRNRNRNDRRVDDDRDYPRRNAGYNDNYPSEKGVRLQEDRTNDEIVDRKIEPSKSITENRPLRSSMEETRAYRSESGNYDYEYKRPPRRSEYDDSSRRDSSYHSDETRVYSSRSEDESDRRERKYDDTRTPCTKRRNSFSEEPEGLSFRRIDDSDDCDRNYDEHYSTRAPSSTREYKDKRSSTLRPLTPKEIIDEAYRHDEVENQPRAAIYPVFNPRLTNITSPEVIRPSERKGTTLTARRRKRRTFPQEKMHIKKKK